MVFLTIETIKEVLLEEGEEDGTLVVEGICPACERPLSDENRGFGGMWLEEDGSPIPYYGKHDTEKVLTFRCERCMNMEELEIEKKPYGLEGLHYINIHILKHLIKKVAIRRNFPNYSEIYILEEDYRWETVFFWDTKYQEVLRPHFGFDEHGGCMPLEWEFEQGSSFVPSQGKFRIGDSLIETIRQEFIRVENNIAELVVNDVPYMFIAESLHAVGCLGDTDPDISAWYEVDPKEPCGEGAERKDIELFRKRIEDYPMGRLIGIPCQYGNVGKESSQMTYSEGSEDSEFTPECNVMARIIMKRKQQQAEIRLGRKAFEVATGTNGTLGSGPGNLITKFLGTEMPRAKVKKEAVAVAEAVAEAVAVAEEETNEMKERRRQMNEARLWYGNFSVLKNRTRRRRRGGKRYHNRKQTRRL